MSTVSNLFTNISNQTDCPGPGIALQRCKQKSHIYPNAAAVRRSGGREAVPGILAQPCC